MTENGLSDEVRQAIEREYFLIRRAMVMPVLSGVAAGLLVIGVGGYLGAVEVAREAVKKQLGEESGAKVLQQVKEKSDLADAAIKRVEQASKDAEATIQRLQKYDANMKRVAEVAKSTAWLLRYDWSRGVFDTANPEVKQYHESTYSRAEALFNEISR